jgi:hypothetical protein
MKMPITMRGFHHALRTVTMIKVEPLPEGTTDIDTLETGWDFVDENKILVLLKIIS